MVKESHVTERDIFVQEKTAFCGPDAQQCVFQDDRQNVSMSEEHQKQIIICTFLKAVCEKGHKIMQKLQFR